MARYSNLDTWRRARSHQDLERAVYLALLEHFSADEARLRSVTIDNSAGTTEAVQPLFQGVAGMVPVAAEVLLRSGSAEIDDGKGGRYVLVAGVQEAFKGANVSEFSIVVPAGAVANLSIKEYYAEA